MQRILLILCIVLISRASLAKHPTDYLREGDIIFQVSQSNQSKSIQIATNSQYSHVGILYLKGNTWHVVEAVQPVKLTPLIAWIERGRNHHYVVKRLKDADAVLTNETLNKLRRIEQNFLGKNYDIYFSWTDDELYCSELVYKAYVRATGIKVGKLKKLRAFNLKHPVVAQKLRERYGNNIPYDETVISPESIFKSQRLITVKISSNIDYNREK